LDWRRDITSDFEQVIARYKSGHPPLIRLALIDACSLLTDAFKQHLVVDLAADLPGDVTLLILLQDYASSLQLDRNNLAELRSLNKLRNDIVHQRAQVSPPSLPI
jgi:hypothetical protein